MRPNVEAWDDWGDVLEDVTDVTSRTSGTRRAAQRAHAPTEEAPQSQRPTMPAPPDLLQRLANDKRPIDAKQPTETIASIATREFARPTAIELAPEDVPRIARQPGDGEVDHVTGFMLSRIDGRSTVDELLDVSGMPVVQARNILAYLWQRGFITFR